MLQLREHVPVAIVQHAIKVVARRIDHLSFASQHRARVAVMSGLFKWLAAMHQVRTEP